MPTNAPVIALVLARPGALRDGLAALLTAIPRIGTIQVTDDVQLALQVMSESGKAVVLADVSCLNSDAEDVLAQMREACPTSWIALLVDTGQEQQAYRGTAASHIVLKGYPAGRLSQLIEEHLQQSGS